MTCTLDLDNNYRQNSSYWNLNTSLLSRRAYWDRISALVKWALTGAIINSRWWFAFKRAMKAEAVGYSKLLPQDRNRVEELVRRLDEAISPRHVRGENGLRPLHQLQTRKVRRQRQNMRAKKRRYFSRVRCPGDGVATRQQSNYLVSDVWAGTDCWSPAICVKGFSSTLPGISGECDEERRVNFSAYLNGLTRLSPRSNK